MTKETLVPLTLHLPAKANIGPVAVITTGLNLRNNYAPLEPHRSGTEGIESGKLSFGSVSCGLSNNLGSRGNMGKEPIPLTPEKIHLLNRLEPDKISMHGC